MSKISDYSFSFSLVRNYVVFSFKRYYGEFIVVGRENIPEDGPVIFAPNHVNALMDAIAVHSIAPYKMPLIFLARSDIFKNKTAVKILKFTKILPAFRMRDGMENLGKNKEVFEQCVEILEQNKALGIMPEGNQGKQRKLRPLVKGIFRIAFAAQLKYDSQPKIKIVPVGIDYGDLMKYGKHIIINIGKPIEMSEYMKSYAINTVIATNEIREKLWNDLNTLSLNLASEIHYECFGNVVDIATNYYVKKLDLLNNTKFRFTTRQAIAKRLVELEKAEPEKTDTLDYLAKNYMDLLNKLDLQNWVLEQKSIKIPAIILGNIMLILTFPFFIYGFIFNFFPFFAPSYIRKNIMKVQYDGFFSSLQFGLALITFPLFYLLQTILFCILTGYPWWSILTFFFLQYPFGLFAIKWNSNLKKFFAKLRFRKLNRNKSFDLAQAQKLREQIIQLISLT